MEANNRMPESEIVGPSSGSVSQGMGSEKEADVCLLLKVDSHAEDMDMDVEMEVDEETVAGQTVTGDLSSAECPVPTEQIIQPNFSSLKHPSVPLDESSIPPTRRKSEFLPHLLIMNQFLHLHMKNYLHLHHVFQLMILPCLLTRINITWGTLLQQTSIMPPWQVKLQVLIIMHKLMDLILLNLSHYLIMNQQLQVLFLEWLQMLIPLNLYHTMTFQVVLIIVHLWSRVEYLSFMLYLHLSVIMHSAVTELDQAESVGFAMDSGRTSLRQVKLASDISAVTSEFETASVQAASVASTV